MPDGSALGGTVRAQSPKEPRGAGASRGPSGAWPDARGEGGVDRVSVAFEADVMSCPRCGGPMVVLATIDDPAMIARILTHLILGALRERSRVVVPTASSAAHRLGVTWFRHRDDVGVGRVERIEAFDGGQVMRRGGMRVALGHALVRVLQEVGDLRGVVVPEPGPRRLHESRPPQGWSPHGVVGRLPAWGPARGTHGQHPTPSPVGRQRGRIAGSRARPLTLVRTRHVASDASDSHKQSCPRCRQ